MPAEINPGFFFFLVNILLFFPPKIVGIKKNKTVPEAFNDDYISITQTEFSHFLKLILICIN